MRRHPFDIFFEWLLILSFAPFLFSLAAQAAAALLHILVPLLLLLAVVAGVVAGIARACATRHRSATRCPVHLPLPGLPPPFERGDRHGEPRS